LASGNTTNHSVSRTLKRDPRRALRAPLPNEPCLDQARAREGAEPLYDVSLELLRRNRAVVKPRSLHPAAVVFREGARNGAIDDRELGGRHRSAGLNAEAKYGVMTRPNVLARRPPRQSNASQDVHAPSMASATLAASAFLVFAI
jgi:hypothetical protein